MSTKYYLEDGTALNNSFAASLYIKARSDYGDIYIKCYTYNKGTYWGISSKKNNYLFKRIQESDVPSIVRMTNLLEE